MITEVRMGYGSKSLNDLRDEAFDTAKRHGFTDASVGEDIALMHSELSEALEDHRAGHAPNHFWYTCKGESVTRPSHVGEDGLIVMHKLEGIPSEMADVIIRALHFCGKHKIDIERAVREKMWFNEQREFMHGKTL
jgi:NTP pyrophosphatase (non-canonical NTP hydrolase)